MSQSEHDLNIADIAAKHRKAELEADWAMRKAKAGSGAEIKPFSISGFQAMPKSRRWVYGHEMAKGVVNIIGGAGGSAKSTEALTIAISIAFGRDLLDQHEGALKRRKVLVINNEDDANEMELRVRAICQLHNVPMGELEGWLMMQSGIDENVQLAQVNIEGKVEESITNVSLERYIFEQSIECVIIDPFVSIHGASENDNVSMNAVMSILKALAVKCSVSMSVVHHAKKGGGTDADESLRGASAIKDAARSLSRMAKMTADEAELFGIPEKERTFYIGKTDGKHNYSATSALSIWYRIQSIKIRTVNEDGEEGQDSVAALERVELSGPEPGKDSKKLTTKTKPVEFFGRVEHIIRDGGGKVKLKDVSEEMAHAGGCTKEMIRRITKATPDGEKFGIKSGGELVHCWKVWDGKDAWYFRA